MTDSNTTRLRKLASNWFDLINNQPPTRIAAAHSPAFTFTSLSAMTKDAIDTINLKRCHLRAIYGGADNIGGDETIAIGYSDHHRHNDSNCKVNVRH
jgi:hypothetical protein